MKFKFLLIALVLLIFSQSVYSACWTICDVCAGTGTQTLTCTINTDRTNSADRINQASVDGFWSDVAGETLDTVIWEIQGRQVWIQNSKVDFIRPADRSTVTWNLRLIGQSGRTTTLRSYNMGSSAQMQFVDNGSQKTFTNITIDAGTGGNQATYLYSQTADDDRRSSIGIDGELSIPNGGRMLYFRNIEAGKMTMDSTISGRNSRIHGLSGDILIHGDMLLRNGGHINDTWTIDSLTVEGDLTIDATGGNADTYINSISGPVNVTGDILIQSVGNRQAWIIGRGPNYITELTARNLTIHNEGDGAWARLFNVRNGNIDIVNDLKITGRYSRIEDFMNGDLIVGKNAVIVGPTYQDNSGIYSSSSGVRFNDMTVGGELILQRKRIYYIDGTLDVTGDITLVSAEIHGKANILANTLTSTSSILYCNGAQTCNLDVVGDIVLSGRGPSSNQSIIYFDNINTTNGNLTMSNGAHIVHVNYTNASGTGIDIGGGLNMTNSQIYFHQPAPIQIRNGDAVITGRYSNYAIYYNESLVVFNGNLTVKRGTTETGRPHSVVAQRGGRVYASGDILIQNIEFDGYDSGGWSGEGIIAFESANGNITFDRAFLRTLRGPLRAANGKITFTGNSISDTLMGNYGFVGLYAQEFEATNARLYNFTYNTSRTVFSGEPGFYGAIKVEGLMKLTNTELADSGQEDIRWIEVGALEMNNSRIMNLSGNITIHDYGQLVDSRIRINDDETIQDPNDSARSIKILNATRDPAFSMTGLNWGEGIEVNWSSPFSIINNDDLTNIEFINTRVENQGEELTISSCKFEGSGFTVQGDGGSIITGDPTDSSEFNHEGGGDSPTHAVHSCGLGGASCAMSGLSPTTFDSDFTGSTTFVVNVTGSSNRPIPVCGSGTGSCTGTSSPYDCSCDYTDLTSQQSISSYIENTTIDCGTRQFSCNDCGGEGLGGYTEEIAIGAFIVDKGTGNPVNGYLEIILNAPGIGEVGCTYDSISGYGTIPITDGLVDAKLNCNTDLKLISGVSHTADVIIVNSGTGATEPSTIHYIP